ncbi:MAG: hypothetical protein HXX11_03215 [Desulfuromonadales bacterium]|nr:hypothetical protein [Desulfuromonadales bacterium]
MKTFAARIPERETGKDSAVKITEKILKARVTELNLGVLKETTFGIRVERSGKGYICCLVYRDQTPPEILLEGGSASEASACIEAVAATQRIFRQSMMGGVEKPEYLTDELFIKKGGERCPKTRCGSRDIIAGWVEKNGSGLTQAYRCGKCGLEFVIVYKMEGYEISGHAEVSP